MKSKDKKVLILLSTVHNSNKMEIQKNNRVKFIPQIIKDCDGKISKTDQNMT